MSKLTLPQIRYYTENDIYEFSVDNRPLTDLASSIDVLNSSLDLFGFYKELAANPETEPPQGFTLFTCAYIGPNSRLYPINIYNSVFLVDYSKVEIVLIVGKTDAGLYKCLTFSSDIQISKSPTFSSSSIGLIAKVGQGGVIFDELSFEGLYATGVYQNITIGKILSPTNITFGGNQVTAVGNNRFLSKNIDDVSSGSITWNRNNIRSSVFFSGTFENSLGSPYPYGEFSLYNSTGFDRKLPIYFTNKPLTSNSVTGSFIDADFFTRLNEVHFASPLVNIQDEQDKKYLSTGVNIDSLLNYTDSFLIRNSSWTSNSGDTLEQFIGTSLKLSQVGSNNLFLSLAGSVDGKTAVADTNVISIGGKPGANGLPENLFFPLLTQVRGITFDGFEDNLGVGAYVGVLQNNIANIEIPLPEDERFIKYSEMAQGKSLLIYHKNNLSSSMGAANIFMYSDGYTMLSARGGVHCPADPILSTELVNLGFLQKTLNSSASTALSVQGNDLNNPIVNSLSFDVSSSQEPNVVFKINSFSEARVMSNTPVEFRATPTTYQTVRGTILNDNSPSASNNDLTTRGYVHYFVAQALTGGSQGLFLTTNTDQAIQARKTFNKTTIFNSDSIDPNTPIILFAPNSAQVLKIGVNIPVVAFEYATDAYSKILTTPTSANDLSTTVTSKSYVDSKDASQIASLANHTTRLVALEGSALAISSLAQNQLLGYGYWRKNHSGAAHDNGSFTTQSVHLINYLVRDVNPDPAIHATFRAISNCVVEYSATITVNPTASFDSSVLLKLGSGDLSSDTTIAEVRVSGSGVTYETVTISALDTLAPGQRIYLTYNTISSTPPTYESFGFIKIIGSV